MGNIKKRIHTGRFKAKVALELIREKDTISNICSRFSIHPTQAQNWKKQVLESLTDIFHNKAKGELKKKDELIDELFKEVGQLKVELDWLKKKSAKLS